MENNFHFIGIGGIGMSGLARLLLEKNYPVSGSDLSCNQQVKKLKEMGARVYHHHAQSNINDAQTTVIYSSAIDLENPEIIQATKLGCKLWHRSDMLASLMQSYSPIAIAGTHGKTSTTALLSHVLQVANLSPSFVIGGMVHSQKCNAKYGHGKYFVVEADESDGSFLKYFPDYSVITNIEADHLNHYSDLEEIKSAFQQFAKQTKDRLIWCYDCENLRKLNLLGLSYGFKEGADLQILNYRQVGFKSWFDLVFEKKTYSSIELSMVGEHNVLNAAAVFAIATLLKIDEKDIKKAFKTHLGVARRCEKIGEKHQVQVYDDYAHHPTEVSTLLKSFKKAFVKRRVIALFQPHRYSRWTAFSDEFVQSFSDADEVWLTDVYSAGEKADESFSIESFVEKIESQSQVRCQYVPKNQIEAHFKKHIRPFDVLVAMGAGDITHEGRKVCSLLETFTPKLKAGLVFGAASHEHYVSFISSQFFSHNYDKKIYDLEYLKILSNGTWAKSDSTFKEKQNLNFEQLIFELKKLDVLLLGTHGKRGEDGELQGFLQTLHMAYTGSKHSQSAINMNKSWMKQIVKGLGIETVDGISFNQRKWSNHQDNLLNQIQKDMDYPLVVKPTNMGSTIGVNFVESASELKNAIDKVFAIDDQVMIEKRIFARELEVSCLDTEEGLFVAAPGEIRSNERFYDYQAKYSKNPIEKVVCPKLDPEISQKAQLFARQIYEYMNLSTCARVDFFLTDENKLIFAEVNTLPGMTPKSLFQRTLQDQGYSYNKIINQMVIDALYQARIERKKDYQVQKFLQTIKDVTH